MASFIVDGTKLRCTMGTESAELKTSVPRSLSIGGKDVVTAKDCIPYINIGCFGKCNTFPQENKPCTPTGAWINTCDMLTVDDTPALTDKSQIICACGGGLITIQGAEK